MATTGSPQPSASEKPQLVKTDSKTAKEAEANQGQSIRQRAMATIEDDDERLLARIGYKQVRE